VVQISKIQLRRGQKNSQSGIPQLSSAEMAWAVDTQELFIGNGSVSEGAPYVGNTKIITEHDNILDLISGYRFANDDVSITESTTRSLQGKLDEYVSVLDYGAVADGSTDCTDAFERACTELFRNVNDDYKKVLMVPNGIYLFTRDLEIPSNTKLRGETRDGAILHLDQNNVRLLTSTGAQQVNFSSTNRPENIEISNLTVRRSSGQFVITGAKNCSFSQIKFSGEYFLGNGVSVLSTEPSAVFWQNTILGTVVDDIEFRDCYFESNSLSVKCLQTVIAESRIDFMNCFFYVNDTGIYVEGIQEQETSWKIDNCRFEEIFANAFRATQGRGTLINSCRFKNCGNGINSANNPSDNIVYFGESRGNIVKDCSFDRQQSAGVVSSSSIPAISEVYNANHVNIIDKVYSEIFLSDSFRPLIALSAFNKFTYVNYVLRMGGYIRSGILSIIIGDDLSGTDDISEVTISDHYQYSASSTTSPGGPLMTNFEFRAVLNDNDADSGPETIVLQYKNPVISGSLGDITLDVSYGV
jgi:hypothetical protein